MNREREFTPHVREEKGILQGPLHPGDSPSWKNRLEPGNALKFTGRASGTRALSYPCTELLKLTLPSKAEQVGVQLDKGLVACLEICLGHRSGQETPKGTRIAPIQEGTR